MQKLACLVLGLVAHPVVADDSRALFTGGRADGSAHVSLVSTPAAGSRWLAQFSGGGNDGYASARLPSNWPQSPRAPFLGGGLDGSDAVTFLAATTGSSSARFAGGAYDGFDRTSSSGNPTWILGDSDRNGLPDWWELQYFSVLTGTLPTADADLDGATNLSEYLAGTNPLDAASVFRISGLTWGSPSHVTVYCQPGLFYTLQRTDELLSTWTSVNGQVRVPANAAGSIELTDPSSGQQRFYRVLVEP